jgi:hypothetical protein
MLTLNLDLISNPTINEEEEHYLRKSRSTYMNSGWGINKRHFMKDKSSKRIKTEFTSATSPETRKLKSHKSYTSMKTYHDQARRQEKNLNQGRNEIVEFDKESDEDDDHWIGADQL